MSNETAVQGESCEPIVSPVDCLEIPFGLFRALTFIGAVSAATAGLEVDPNGAAISRSAPASRWLIPAKGRRG